MPKEVWKDIPEYTGYYQVSNWGRVRSITRRITWRRYGKSFTSVLKGRLMSPYKKKSGVGHLLVILTKGGKGVLVPIHRLVLSAFVGPCPAGMEARHYPDRDPENNRLENLSWSTHAVNMADTIQHGTTTRGRSFPRDVGHGSAIHSQKTIARIRKLYATGRYTQEDLARQFGGSRCNISMIVNNVTWKHVNP